MRSHVRYLAAASAASMLVFAACGGDTGTPTSPDLAAAGQVFTVTPAVTGWTKQPADPLPTDSRTVLIGGLIAIGGYPQFGQWQWSGGNDWVEMNASPDLSRSPLAWRFTFKLKPKAATLPVGTYQVTIPVTVAGASNNPRSITVTFSNCGNCLFVGDVKSGDITPSSPRYDRNSFFGVGDYPYQDWRVFVEPGATVYVQLIPSASNSICNETGTLGSNLSDPFLRIFDGTTSIGSNDDTCGYASQVAIFNGTGVRKEFVARAGPLAQASSHSPPYLVFANYVIRVVSVPFGGDDDLRADDGRTEEQTIAYKLAQLKR